MMDQSAIQQIQNAAGIDNALAALKQHETAMPLVALPDSFTVHDLERFMPNRARFRGNMTTNVLAAFTDYAKRHVTDDAACFVDGERMKAEVIFDLGEKDVPGHCEHRATVTAVKLAEYQALLSIDGARTEQKAIAEWVEDWRANITASDADGNQLEVSRVVSALRQITIEGINKSNHEVGNVRASKSSLEEIEAKSAHAIPATISFTCRPYECIAARTFDMRLSILTSHDKPMFVLRIRQLEKHEEDIAFEFTELVKNGLADTGIETFMGKFNP